ERILVVRAVRIDPELEHPARAMERPGDHPLALQLANVAEVDEEHVVLAETLPRLREADGRDSRLRLVDELTESLLERHGHVLRARLYHREPSRIFRARANTARSIGRVSLPVNVFCWLGW